MAKSKATDGQSQPRASGAGSSGGHLARILAIVLVNLTMVAVAICFKSSALIFENPDFSRSWHIISILPVSAAMGMILACRRIDFSLPAILALAMALSGTHGILSSDPFVRLLTVCGIAAGIGLLSALVTWYGRISSALWSILLMLGLWELASARGLVGAGPWTGPWAWEWAAGISVGLIALGAVVLGATGLVAPPSSPPIIRSGSKGLLGLALAWAIAGAGVAMASQSDSRELGLDLGRAPYVVYAAAALGGSHILRGRWGMPTAVALTCLAHVAWSYVSTMHFSSRTADILVSGGAPLIAIPLYLAIDWLIRRRTGESAPTGLLA